MSFDIRKIVYFLAVIDHRNISRAAEALRVSQPTLSRQIHALEVEFNAPLFIRQGRGVLPTEAGKRLHQGLRGLEHQLRTLKDDVAAAAGEPSGEVAIGIPPSPRELMAVTIADEYRKRYPKVAIRFSERTSGEIRDTVARGEVDIAIVNEDEPMDGLVAEPFAAEPMLLVGPKSAGLSLDVPTPTKMLGELPLILTTNPNSLRRMVDFELLRLGLRSDVRAEADLLPLLYDLVIHGHGYTVLPSCGVFPLIQSGRLSGSPLSGLRITWTIARPANRSLTMAGRKLADVVLQVAKEKITAGSWPLAELVCKRGPDKQKAQKMPTIEIAKKTQPAVRKRMRVT
jgi:LysR family transcriptional regulator, nitrogen assimilation regulatory protein